MARKGDYAKLTPEQKKKEFERIQKIQKETTIVVRARLHKQYDKDIIDYLEKCESKSALIKHLIREYAKVNPEPEF